MPTPNNNLISAGRKLVDHPDSWFVSRAEDPDAQMVADAVWNVFVDALIEAEGVDDET